VAVPVYWQRCAVLVAQPPSLHPTHFLSGLSSNFDINSPRRLVNYTALWSSIVLLIEKIGLFFFSFWVNRGKWHERWTKECVDFSVQSLWSLVWQARKHHFPLNVYANSHYYYGEGAKCSDLRLLVASWFPLKISKLRHNCGIAPQRSVPSRVVWLALRLGSQWESAVRFWAWQFTCLSTQATERQCKQVRSLTWGCRLPRQGDIPHDGSLGMCFTGHGHPEYGRREERSRDEQGVAILQMVHLVLASCLKPIANVTVGLLCHTVFVFR
jgi:hypothetical protein